MLTVLSAGLPVSAKDILSSALNEAFGGDIEIQELNKDNIRRQVRLSTKSVGVVLVVLDTVSSELCSDIENGLYSSDKYFTYTTDKELANFLNRKYGLSIEVEEDIEEVFVEENSNIGIAIEEYENRLRFKDDTIFNLETRIRDLVSFYEGSDSPAESEEVSKKVSELSEEVQNLKSQLSLSDETNTQLRMELANKEKELSDLTTKLKRLSSSYDDVKIELDTLKVDSTKLSGILRDKDAKIEDLNSTIADLKVDLEKLKSLEADIDSYKNQITGKDKTIRELRVDLDAHKRDCSRLSEELVSLRPLKDVGLDLEDALATIKSLETEMSSVTSENVRLSKDLLEAENSNRLLTESNESHLARITELSLKVSDLNDRIEEDSESLSKLNKDKLELQRELAVASKNSSFRGSEDLEEEIGVLRDKLSDITNSIFYKIGASSLPNASINYRILEGLGKFRNVRFAFSGSADSRKGSYKCLYEEFKSDRSGSRYLIVDLVSETAVDYVFVIKNLISGKDWFTKGGSIQRYLSETSLRNTKVLSVGLNFINDSYFLCIDWVKRLKELEDSGYKVVVFCGDISNIVGRVLHESFSNLGETTIYVSGSAMACRSVITNLRGLPNAKTSLIAYYDYNPAMDKFYNSVSKNYRCRVLSEKSTARR